MKRVIVEAVLAEVALEVESATSQFPRFNSSHEALAVIEEEFDEYRREVFKNRKTRDRGRMREELIQIAAMAVRAIYDLHSYTGSDASDGIPSGNGDSHKGE